MRGIPGLSWVHNACRECQHHEHEKCKDERVCPCAKRSHP